MRIVSAIDRPLADEHVIATDPPLSPNLPVFWRRRINPFTGRALSDRALSAEQDSSSGVQRLRGQAVSAGVIAGLDVLAEAGSVGSAPADARVQILAGSGLSRAGEDVIVASPRRLALADLPVFARVDQLDAIIAGDPAGGTSDDPVPDGDALPGLFPPRPRRMGPRLGDLLAAPAAADLPRAAVLVAEPVTATINPRARDKCPPDPRDDPYDDLQRIDGCRLALFLWPTELRARVAGPDYALPPIGPARRNRLAYGVFGVERGMPQDAMHPWERLGVPLAIIGFRADWSLDFIDRAAVVRMGGQPKPRTRVVPFAGQSLLWQARVAQFMEQLSGLPDFTQAAFTGAFRQLPPVGFLPLDLVDLTLRSQRVFPAGFTLEAAPIPADQIDVAVRESAAMVPFSLDVPDEVQLLVPVPPAAYEPGLLQTATLDPEFARATTRYTIDRTNWLVRRELVRRRRDLLRDAATGQRPAWLAEDLPEGETNPFPASRAPVTATRVRRVAAAGAPRTLRLLGAGSSLALAKGDTLYVWVRVIEGGPAALWLRLGTGTAADGSGNFNAGIFFGTAANLPAPLQTAGMGARRRGAVPAQGSWVRLSVPVDVPWQPANAGAAGLVVNGLELGQSNGTVEWGPFGRITADGRETAWVADDAPPGSTLRDSAPGTTGWPQAEAGLEDAPVEPQFATIEEAGVRNAVPIRDLRQRWATHPFLAPEFALLDEGGIDGFTADIDARLKATNDAIDLAFVRARADIFRVRQYMLGADSASRLVTSPALADIAVREDSARGRSVDLASFVKSAYQTDFRRDPDEPLETKPKPRAGSTQPPPPPPPSDAPPLFAVLAFQPQIATFFSTTTTTTATAFSGAFTRRATAQTGVSLAALNVSNDRIGIQNVRAQLALPGFIERTATIAERLKPPPSVEAYNEALAGKLRALNALAGLVDASTGRPKGIALGDLVAPGFRYLPDNLPAAPRVAGTIADVLAHRAQYEDSDVLRDTDARHEADYFNAAVRAIDNAIALMRLVEGRVALYENLVADAREVRTQLLGWIDAADARLRAIGVELEEARHDVGVASALLAEEQARVDALNAKRRAVLENHVDAVLFRRAPRVERRRVIPTEPASAALVAAPAAVCLRDHQAVPEEIQEFVALFRDAPVAWFPHVLSHVRRIDRLEAARRAMLAVKSRAAASVAATARAFSGTKLLAAVQQATLAQSARFDFRRLAAAQLDIASIAAMDILGVQRALSERASLGDIAAGDHHRADLARIAAQELESISQVAACLHDAFGESPPVMRLAWAELLSAFDQPAPLSQLAGLPRWSELPLDLRRTQQGLVDWLLSRTSDAVPQAESAMNELVRVCLLMAAHAPVDRVIPARLVAPAPARPGIRLDLAVDIRLVRIGQTALVRGPGNSVLAQAVVEDLADGIARARITKSFQPTATIEAGVRIELGEALRF